MDSHNRFETKTTATLLRLEWLAALIVGAALLAIAAVAALTGKGRLQKAAPLVPEETVGSIQADVEEIKERTRR